ncbi:MAG: T9SS type A sorting domain-containing protein [Bacteroidales bacterium]|jgi:hypothetical protein|nr:T9SS type A sorting domain-containing protein [Bacteroidales bacterium]
MENLKVIVLASMLTLSISGINSVKSQECSAIFDTELSSNPKRRAVSNPQLPESYAAVTVDVLIVYTPAAKQWTMQNGYNIDNLIDSAIQRSNLVFSNSQTGVTLRLAHKQEIDYAESNSLNDDLYKLRDSQDGKADEVHALRTQYNADLVVLLVGEVSVNNVLGAGYIPNDEWGNSKSGFSVSRVKTLPDGFTFPHELGHNFGCGHHTDVDYNALYNYAHGHRGITNQSNKFSTIMTYETTTGIYYPHVPYFSDPNIEFEGVKVGTADANNAKAIRQFKSVVTNYSEEAKYIDAFLKAINVSEGSLSPVFNAGVYNYTVDVPNSIEYIDIEGITNSSYAQVLSGNQTAMPLNIGDNVVEIFVKDGWENYNKKYTLNIIRAASTATGIDKIDSDLIRIYPNPIVDELKIDNENLNIKSVQITDISNKIIYNVQNSNLNSINVSHLPCGIYILKIETNKNVITKKFVKN